MIRFLAGLTLVFFLLVVPVWADEILEEKVEARVNDRILTTTELERRLAPLYLQYEDSVSAEELPRLKQQARGDAVSGWIDEQLMLIEAQRHEEIKVDPIEIEREFRQTINRFPSREFFFKSLQEEGLTEEKFKEKIAEGIKMRELLYIKVASKVNVSPGEIIAYYDEHSDEFETPQQVRVSIIMIPAPNEEGDKRLKASVLAQEIMDKLEQGEDFADLARNFSQGPNAPKGGDMGYFRADELLEETSQAIEGLKVGSYTGLMETAGGFQIIKVTGRKQASYKSLEDVWQSIHEQLFFSRRRELQEAWLAELRSQAYIFPEQ